MNKKDKILEMLSGTQGGMQSMQSDIKKNNSRLDSMDER